MHFIESGCLLPCSQKPAISVCREPHKSSQCRFILCLYDTKTITLSVSLYHAAFVLKRVSYVCVLMFCSFISVDASVSYEHNDGCIEC